MTQLLNAEFENEHGEKTRLSREELLAYVNIIDAAGNETTRILIGWATKLLAEHPDQRRRLVEDPSLTPMPSTRCCATRATRCKIAVTLGEMWSCMATWCPRAVSL